MAILLKCDRCGKELDASNCTGCGHYWRVAMEPGAIMSQPERGLVLDLFHGLDGEIAQAIERGELSKGDSLAVLTLFRDRVRMVDAAFSEKLLPAKTEAAQPGRREG